MMRFLLCGLLAWLMSSIAGQAADAEDKAVAFVAKLKGTVTRDDKQPGKTGKTVVEVNSKPRRMQI